ncbi:MAG: UDP-3-O-(3-hydroxymyristoyl)glucosamine N-acyltransferase [Bacteroidales bacterium]|jgi:UDP-3-O-[3-hydroxymyristoyl] glucosamine N-acyltransferase|nr:UDP-3-O-(3-hydroxymyristoyl)glucosamine N-acyltransferase [Bacteroidales bacterium]
MKFTAEQIAEVLNGKVEGSKDVEVHTLSKIEEGNYGSLSFLANPKYTPYIYDTQASIVIVNDDFQATKALKCTLIRVKDAYSAFSQLLNMYNQVKLDKSGISSQAAISETAKIGENVYIGEFVIIGDNAVIGNNAKIYPQTFIGENCKIGENTTFFPGVKIYSDCNVGKDCTFHAGVVIGSDGFGFAPQAANNYKKVAQIGNVIIEDDVEIGANTTIDRATLGSTIIRKGVKLDNLIQIAHNVEIGENTVMAAQSGVSGSTKIGKNCMIGGQVGMTGHISIGDNVKIGAQAGIMSNVKDGQTIIGSPAIEVGAFMKSSVYFKKLPELAKKIYEIEKKLQEG